MALSAARAVARFLRTAGNWNQATDFPRVNGRSLGVPSRHYAPPAAKATKKPWVIKKTSATKKTSTEAKKQQRGPSQEEREKLMSDTSQPKPFGLTAWEPVDDVYLVRYYPKPIYEIETAIEMLKQFQQLDFTDPSQVVHVELRLDMTMEKKKLDPFISTMHLPYPLISETNKVLVFTENAKEAKVAEDNGAAFVGGAELIKKILNEEIQADFYVAVPEILPKLDPLKNKLRNKFPKSKRGSVNTDIPKMLKLFKNGYQYQIADERFVRTEIATLDMPSKHIIANVDAVIKDVCTHRPLSYGPFINRSLIWSLTSEALNFKFEHFLPQPEEEIKPEDSN
ncbi:large ribosomal subunit protein uL1m [Microcaecilia unicolor]|uniref:Large ribosomal subunit protein uL1m n=1 Tax=Microcaecilia unicolor TaxID=1415580 RepID=A0A6P7X1Q0_9AMPH|nr:39S ribosomal protein L1, mitochondrial [Microcaecilia unicolor]